MNPQDAHEISEAVKLLQELFNQRPNEWLPVYAAIGGAFIGAIASFIPILVVEIFNNRKEAKYLELSMVFEITSLVELIDTRGYIKDIENIIEKFNLDPTLKSHSYTIGVDSEYSRIYQANCNRIGLINSDTAIKIIKFHQLIDAVVQDVKPGGALSNGNKKASFEQTKIIFEKALQIGSQLKNN